MMLVPLALYLFIAVGARTGQTEDFFASGRRVPPVYNGFVLAAIAVGGVGFLAYTGTAFFLGFDAMAIGLGLTFGMLAAAILFVPYLRKAGAYTLPSFFGHRFRSRLLRAAASIAQLPPLTLLLAAEIKIAALLASLFLPLSFAAAVILVAALIRGDCHSWRHALDHLGGKRRVPRRRGRAGGRDRRFYSPHQLACAATHLWRAVRGLAAGRDGSGSAAARPMRPRQLCRAFSRGRRSNRSCSLSARRDQWRS